MLSNMVGHVGGKCEMLRVNSDLTVVAYGDLWEVADRELQGGLLVLGEGLVLLGCCCALESSQAVV